MAVYLIESATIKDQIPLARLNVDRVIADDQAEG